MDSSDDSPQSLDLFPAIEEACGHSAGDLEMLRALVRAVRTFE